MKKKLAIAMAVVMTLAPMNLFAASNNRPSKVPTVVPGKTLFMESSWISNKGGIVDLDALNKTADETYKTDDIEYVVSGTDLIITLKDDVSVGDEIQLRLENAKWYFKNSESDAKLKANTLTTITSGASLVTTTTYDTNKGNWANNTYTRFATSKEIPYELAVSRANDSEATMTITANGVVDDTIVVPLVSLSTDEGDVRVVIEEGNLTTISSANIQYGKTSATNTKTFVKTIEEARTVFPLDQIVVQENGISSIKKMNDLLTITAPSGFTFTVDKDGVKVSVEGGLGLSGTVPAPTFPTDYDGERVSFNLSNVIPSTRITGKIIITGLSLVAEEDAPWGDVNLKIAGGNGVTEQTFKAAKRVDWLIDMKAGTVPTLVNGRYVDEDSSKANDDRHKAAEVTFAELAPAAWWAERSTTFELSKGAKFRKVEITDSAEFVDKKLIEATYTPVYETNNYANNVKKGAVIVDGSKITVNSIKVNKDKKAKFIIKSWLSIESGVEGDVTLTATGSAIPQTLAPVVIAKAVSPITIDTKVSDIKIGYQWQKLADFTITETAPGMLERGKVVDITLTDEISNDGLRFTPDAVAEVIGNWKLKDFQSDAGNINFTIDRVSTDKAGSVKFTNVNLKIDRNVPESNKQPYKLVVGGSAVAANYSDARTLKFDMFKTAGIKADYINVITSATNSTGEFTTVVKVTIGDKVISVGQGTMEMDTAAFIDAASASTMVPVRFISQALGIPEGQIKWSDKDRTVTILAPNRTIQFTIGSSDLYINGSKITMQSEEGYPVKAMIVEEVEGRSFIPFRALGDALGVTVAWDATTKTATYNSDLEVKNAN